MCNVIDVIHTVCLGLKLGELSRVPKGHMGQREGGCLSRKIPSLSILCMAPFRDGIKLQAND